MSDCVTSEPSAVVCVRRASRPLTLQQYGRKALMRLFVCDVVMAGLRLLDPEGVSSCHFLEKLLT